MPIMKQPYRVWIFLLAPLAIAACGGGAGVDAPIGVAPPPPTPAPPVPPPESDILDDPEIETTGLAVYQAINIAPALEAGLTGAGQIVGIVDTGIDVDNREFEGRILPQSADVVPLDEIDRTPILGDDAGHGTSVASIIAGATDGFATRGIAPEASILAFRTDVPTGSLELSSAAIGIGTQMAIENGASVINFSLGFGAADPAAPFISGELIEAAAGGAAFLDAADTVFVFAAGNDGAGVPDALALAAATESVIADRTLIVGAANNAATTLTEFSNQAGTGPAAERFLVAPGETIGTANAFISPTATPNTNITFFTGTSASTPIVSGAALLLREAWPDLPAADIADILLETATDLGAPGTDAIFGRGLLNIGAALEPVGDIMVASATGPVPAAASAMSVSPAFGIALNGLADTRVTTLDSYGRDFKSDLSAQVNRQSASGMALGLRSVATETVIDQQTGTLNLTPETGNVSMLVVAEMDRIDPIEHSQALGLRQDLEPRAANVRSLVSADYGRWHFAAGHGFGLDQTTDQNGPFNAGFLASAPGQPSLNFSQPEQTVALGVNVTDKLRWTTGYERQAAPDHLNPLIGLNAPGLQGAQRLMNRLDYAISGFGLAVEYDLLMEEGGVFGTQSSGGFTLAEQSQTHVMTLSASRNIAGLTLFARGTWAQAQTQAGANSLVASVEGLAASSWSVAAARRGLVTNYDTLVFSISQPLRVESGLLTLGTLARNDQGRLVETSQILGLTAGRRQIDLEARYSLFAASGLSFEVNTLYQRNAGHQAGDIMGLRLVGRMRF